MNLILHENKDSYKYLRLFDLNLNHINNNNKRDI